MLKKVKKLFLYIGACHKWELLKRLEYKIKDIVGYFYIRNKKHQENMEVKAYNKKIKIPDIKSDITNENYKVFNNTFRYNKLTEFLECNEEFWRKIDISKYEDVKIIWEYNRLQLLLPIAIKYIKTKEYKYKNNILEILDFWEKNNPYEYTINWNSNLEVAIRSINIILTLLVIQDKICWDKYKNLLYLHAKHIYSEIEYSNCCIPNNHVIGEATALLILSKILDCKENRKWHRKAEKILIKYINIFDSEGISRENSFSYQFFVTKMYIIALCFMEEKDTLEKMNHIIIKSLKFLMHTIVNNDEIFNYGDNDNGFLYSIDMEYNIAKDIKQYYEFFCNQKLSDETNIYKEIFKTFNNKLSIIHKEEDIRDYILSEKIFIYKWNNNALFFNTKDIQGHAHNDSLAINLIIDNKPILLDAGTYSYNKSTEIRKYYRSREAHSTILLEDNAIPIGNFRWKNNKKSSGIKKQENDEKIELNAVIEGTCKRTIVIYKNKNKIEIIDKAYNEEIKTNWILPIDSIIKNNKLCVNNVIICFSDKSNINSKKVNMSKEYLQKEEVKSYIVSNQEKEIKTNIEWE